MNWLGILILCIFFLFMIHGWKKGLLRILFSLIVVIVLMYAISYLTPYVSGYLKGNTDIYQWIQESCAEKIQSHTEDLPVEQEEEVRLPGKIIAYLTDQEEGTPESSSLYQMVSSRAADLILSGISFFVAFILSVIIVKLIDKALGIVNHIPLLKGVNRALGVIAGAVEAYLLVSLLFLFIALISGTEIGKLAIAQINESGAMSVLYYNNVLQNLLLFG